MSSVATADTTVTETQTTVTVVKAVRSKPKTVKKAAAPSDAFLKELKDLKVYIDEHHVAPDRTTELGKFVQKQMSLKRAYERFVKNAENNSGSEDNVSSSSDTEAAVSTAVQFQQQQRKFGKLKSSILTWTNFYNKYSSVLHTRGGVGNEMQKFMRKIEILRGFAARKGAAPVYDRNKKVDPDENKYSQARTRVLKHVRLDKWPEPAEKSRAVWEQLKTEYPFLAYVSNRRMSVVGSAQEQKEHYLAAVDPALQEFIAFPDE